MVKSKDLMVKCTYLKDKTLDVMENGLYLIMNALYVNSVHKKTPHWAEC